MLPRSQLSRCLKHFLNLRQRDFESFRHTKYLEDNKYLVNTVKVSSLLSDLVFIFFHPSLKRQPAHTVEIGQLLVIVGSQDENFWFVSGFLGFCDFALHIHSLYNFLS
jgi:hypothetical protein